MAPDRRSAGALEPRSPSPSEDVRRHRLYDVYGAGGHAQVVMDILAANGIAVRTMYNDAIDPAKQHPASRDVEPGLRLVGPEAFGPLDLPLVLAVGVNGQRAELAQVLSARFGARFGTAVHPSVLVSSSAMIGEGSTVHHGSVVQANAVIGRHVLINTAVSVDHDCVVGDYAHVSPQVALCGHVTVGEGTHVGAGAVVIPGVRIGRWCRVGAGAVVLRDLPDGVTAVGNPARVLVDRHGEPQPDPAFIRSEGRIASVLAAGGV